MAKMGKTIFLFSVHDLTGNFSDSAKWNEDGAQGLAIIVYKTCK